MKYLPNIIGALLGLMFIAFGGMVLLNMAPPQPEPPAGSPTALFMGAMGPSGYMKFVKVLEVLGGLLLVIPRTRNFGLLIIGPIIVNILAFHIFLAGGKELLSPILIVICCFALYLLWAGRSSFCGLLGKGPAD